MSFHPNRPNGMPPDSPAPAGAGSLRAAARGIADGLCLAATPAFAIMALLTAASGGPGTICSAAPGAPLLSGMVPMYVMMSVFHSAPWLKLVSGRRSDARRP